MTVGRRKAAFAAGTAVVTAAAVAAGAGAAGPLPGTGPKAAAWIGVAVAVTFAAGLVAAMAMLLKGADLMRTAGRQQEDSGLRARVTGLEDGL